MPCAPAGERRIYKRYKALAKVTQGAHFAGQPASYQYYDMDQVVARALATSTRIAPGGAEPGGAEPSWSDVARRVPDTLPDIHIRPAREIALPGA